MILAQKAVIEKEGQLLLLLRSIKEKAFPGLWDFPGGRWEEGEEVIESLKREVFEETALTIIPTPKPIGVFHAEVKPGVPVEFRVYTLKKWSGTVRIGVEHSEFKWIEPEKILDAPTMPYMASFLKNWKP